MEGKLGAKDEEFKNNEIVLVAKTERYERAKAEIGLLKRELAYLHAENKSLQNHLSEAKADAAKVISEYQSSAKMVALKQSIQDEVIEEAVESFAYTTTVQYPD